MSAPRLTVKPFLSQTSYQLLTSVPRRALLTSVPRRARPSATMSAFDLVANMHDVALKPRLLAKILREYVPDEKRPFQVQSEISTVVSLVKTHKLLSESSSRMDQKIINSWKSVVDSWVDRVLLLLSSSVPDKCWLGICLIGVTCQECCSDRFLASYSDWFDRLLPHIQSPADSNILKRASCASVSDLFIRLGEFQNLKKDGTSCAGKVIQPVLKLLNDGCTEVVWEGAVHLLCTSITFFPSSVRRFYDSAEAAISSRIMSGECSAPMLEKLAYCLALLTKSRGDEDSWILLIQKILLSINDQLNDIFQGLDEDSKSIEFIRSLIPTGKDLPLPLGCCSLEKASQNNVKRAEHVQTSIASTLMLCCCKLLTGFSPAQVTVPVRSLFILVERVLTVDGSPAHNTLSFMTAMQQESICSQLPALHANTLEMLISLIKGLCSQLLPHATTVARLISTYFKRCMLAELRIKLYKITKLMMMSMGAGMAVCLGQEVINNAFADLNPKDIENSSTSNLLASNKSLLQPGHKKRKVSAADQLDGDISVAQSTKNPLNPPVSLQIAALEALETILNVGGAFKSEGWRSKVDKLLITIATDSFNERQFREDNYFQQNEASGIWEDFQLAAFGALLSSLLSSARNRPTYLAQGLELFGRGKQETGTRLSEFCVRAMLSMEVLIHPRALPMLDYAPANFASTERLNPRINGTFNSEPFKIGRVDSEMYGSDSDEDYLHLSQFGKGKEAEGPVDDLDKNTKYIEDAFDSMEDSRGENHLANPPLDVKTLEPIVEEHLEINRDTTTGSTGDVMQVDSLKSKEFHEKSQELQRDASDDATARNSEMAFGACNRTSEMESAQDNLMKVEGNVLSPTTSDSMGNEELAISIENDSAKKLLDDEDDFPDLIDADPDSDFE